MIIVSVIRDVGAELPVHLKNTAYISLMALSWESMRSSGALLLVQVRKLMVWMSLSSGVTVGCVK